MNPEAMTRFVDALVPALAQGDAALDQKHAEQANVNRLHAFYDALRQQDIAAVRQAMTDDIELEITGPATLPLAGRWTGRDAVLAAAARNFALIEDQKPEILSLVAQGDTIAVVARERGRWRATGAEYDVRWLQLFTLREGRISRTLEFCDNPGALGG